MFYDPLHRQFPGSAAWELCEQSIDWYCLTGDQVPARILGHLLPFQGDNSTKVGSRCTVFLRTNCRFSRPKQARSHFACLSVGLMQF